MNAPSLPPAPPGASTPPMPVHPEIIELALNAARDFWAYRHHINDVRSFLNGYWQVELHIHPRHAPERSNFYSLAQEAILSARPSQRAA